MGITNIYHYPISITEDHRIIDGRIFHNKDNAPYFFPTDNIENSRSNLLHEVVIQKWGNYHSAPVEKKLKYGAARVLDAGCGTGIWIFELAKMYPNSTFIGVDITISFTPNNYQKPSNAAFLESNLLEGLPFPDNTFDYIHQRHMITAFTELQWPGILKELARVLKPGGYLELCEYEIHVNSFIDIGKRFHNAIRGFFFTNGHTIDLALKLPKLLENTKEFESINGFEILVETLETVIATWETFQRIIQAKLKISDQNFKKSIDNFRLQSEDPNVKMFAKSHRVYAKKK
ncbi:1274_t:CDS:2 [Entrophospora sp. SA101]|nr:1274_t:CDS:2 [Entrophospora sp. SA101]